MSDLVINNHLIDTPITTILGRLQSELANGKLGSIVEKGNDVKVPCPHHKDGMEKHPSCGIYCGDDKDIEYGTSHCFTCGFGGPLYHFVAECFGTSDDYGKEWLVDRFGNVFVDKSVELPILDLNKKEVRRLNEDKLDEYSSFHPYLTKRKLSQKICEKFKVRYDDRSQCIVFPVWDVNNNLVMTTRRSVNNKTFIIDEGVEKPVYLLNYIQNENIQTVVVCESQINCLYAWSLGFPAIALFGTGTKHQYDILNKSGIRHYVLCLDGDSAGYKGTRRFLSNIRKDVFVDIVNIPMGKDLNDLSQEDAIKLLEECR